MGEDQDAQGARGVDEPGGGDRLPGSRRMPEPVAPDCPRIVTVELLLLEREVVDEAGVEVVLGLVLEVCFDQGAIDQRSIDPGAIGHSAVATPGVDRVPVTAAVAVCVLRRPLGRGDELGQHPGERVDLMAPQLGPGRGAHGLLAQDSLQAEHEAVAHLPARRRLLVSGRHLLESVVECRATCGARGKNQAGVLAVVQERLAEPGRGAAGGLDQISLGLRRQRRAGLCFVHARST